MPINGHRVVLPALAALAVAGTVLTAPRPTPIATPPETVSNLAAALRDAGLDFEVHTDMAAPPGRAPERLPGGATLVENGTGAVVYVCRPGLPHQRSRLVSDDPVMVLGPFVLYGDPAFAAKIAEAAR